jgi:hypothetical protein
VTDDNMLKIASISINVFAFDLFADDLLITVSKGLMNRDYADVVGTFMNGVQSWPG